MKEIRPNNSNCSSNKFPKLTLPFSGQIAYGNMTQRYHEIQQKDGYLYVEIRKEYRGSFPIDTKITSKMVNEILFNNKYEYPGDLGNIADLINSQYGIEGELQGHYYPDLLDN